MPAQVQVLNPATGTAFELSKGERFRITDLEGHQVSDLVVFLAENPTERFSPGDTRKLNNSILLTTGAILYSTKCRPLLCIGADTVGRHDLLSSACSPYDYPLRFGVVDHPSCRAILVEALKPFAIPEHLIPEPFNVFMNSHVTETTGAITIDESPANAGDYVEFESMDHVIAAMTCCPQDQNACNGWRITPLRVSPA